LREREKTREGEEGMELQRKRDMEGEIHE